MAETQVETKQETKQEIKKSKKISDIFSDYKTNSNIADAEIIKMNLIKKINTLEIKIYSTEYIEIKEIWYFEKFLRQRFQFEQIHMIIEYREDVQKKSISAEWENLICYMAHKYPLMRPLLLLKSSIEVNEKNINVYMKIKGADFLKARKLDKELENVIYNLFEKKYTINIEEKLATEEEKAFKERTKKIEEQAVHDAIQGIAIRTHQEKQFEEQAHQEKTQDSNNYAENEIPPIPEGVFNDADYEMPTFLSREAIRSILFKSYQSSGSRRRR